MHTMINMTENGKAIKTGSIFRMECSVSIDINAGVDKIWLLITNAKGFPSWNLTVKYV